MIKLLLTSIVLSMLPIDWTAANYDESKVVSYTLPEVLVTNSGKKVKNSATWENVRRAELLSIFEENEYGKLPEADIKASYKVLEEGEALEGKAIRRQVEITFAGNGHERKALVLIYMPKGEGKYPFFVHPNFQGNATTTTDEAVIPSAKSTDERGHQTSRWDYEEIIDAGYGVATFHYYDFFPDNKDGFSESVLPLFGVSGERKPNGPGSISAWAWGCSRVLDYVLTLPQADPERCIVMGHSRLGKTALWTGANDKRFAMVVDNCSGCSGSALSRRNYGETVAIIDHSFPWWFCPNYANYGADPSKLPMDQHELLALVAPRPLYVVSAKEDTWADPKGMFLSEKAASAVWSLYGYDTFDGHDMPPVNEPLRIGQNGFHIRSGVHDVTDYDWEQILSFANERLDYHHFRKTEDIYIRDPFVLAEDGTYYLYRSTDRGLRVDGKRVGGVEVLKSKDLKNWEGPKTVLTLPEDNWINANIWAPEVHKYEGKYYIFATINTADIIWKRQAGSAPYKFRGTQVFWSDSPEGPFRAFGKVPYTPMDHMCLDGTLWVENGQPYMVYCHEWVECGDGEMMVRPLKKDLSAPDGEPMRLFCASAAPWVSDSETYVTDGPFLYKTSKGKLQMIWSSFGAEGYAIGIAESTSGSVMGPWKQLERPLFTKDGGHGMIFRTFDGKLYLVLHAPNSGNERPHFFEIKDTGDRLEMAD